MKKFKILLMQKLCDPTFWKWIIYAMSAGGTIAAYAENHPRIEALIVGFSLWCSKPIAHIIASSIIYFTSDYLTTPTKLDDVANAIAQGIVDASDK